MYFMTYITARGDVFTPYLIRTSQIINSIFYNIYKYFYNKNINWHGNWISIKFP